MKEVFRLNSRNSEISSEVHSELLEAFIMDNQCYQNNEQRGNPLNNDLGYRNNALQTQRLTHGATRDNYISQLLQTSASQPLSADDESVICLGPPVPSKGYTRRLNTNRIGNRQYQNGLQPPTHPVSSVRQSGGGTHPINLQPGLPSPTLESTLPNNGEFDRSSVIAPNGAHFNVVIGPAKVVQLNEDCSTGTSNGCNSFSPPRRQKRPIERSSRDFHPDGDNVEKQNLSQHDAYYKDISSGGKEKRPFNSMQSYSVDKPLNTEDGKMSKSCNITNEDVPKKRHINSISSPGPSQGTSKNNDETTNALDPYLDKLMKSFREHVKGRCLKYFDLSKPDAVRRVTDGIAGAAKRMKPDTSSFRTILELFSFIDSNNYGPEIDRAYTINKKIHKHQEHVRQIEDELKKMDEKMEEMDVKFVAGISKRGDKKEFSLLKEAYIKKYIEYQEVTGVGTNGPFSIEFDLSDASPYSKINIAVENYLKHNDFKCKHKLERDNFCPPDFPTILELVLSAVAEHKLYPHEHTYAIAENIYGKTIKSYKKARESLMWNNVLECVGDNLSEEQKKALLRCFDTSNSVQPLEEQLHWNAKVAQLNFQQLLNDFADKPINEDDEGIDTEGFYDSDDEPESELCDDEETDEDDSEYDVEDDFINDQDTMPLDS